jgi:ubiquinone/menaquinone biosynthesis C-methylase UbiE
MEESYAQRVAAHIGASTDLVVVDVGGGRSCSFASHLRSTARPRILAVDISRRELAMNTDVQIKCAVDASYELPFCSESVDLLVSRSVLEHLPDVRGFVRSSHRVLKKSALCIHFFPSRLAPFALINRALPHAVSRRLARLADSGGQGKCGFRAFYRGCSPRSFGQVLVEAGFRVIHSECGYYQSPYFNFFIPLFVISAAYEQLISTLRLRELCAYVIVVAQKE